MCFIPIDIFTRVFGLWSSSATKNEKKKHNKPAIRAQSSSQSFPFNTTSIYTSTAIHVMNRNSDRHTSSACNSSALVFQMAVKKQYIKKQKYMNSTGWPALESHESGHGCTDIYTAVAARLIDR